jgi:alkylation response protein AidB-like acyl-CoA dehydrogenase
MHNFYTEDKTLKRLLQEKLPADFFEYADDKLEEFGSLCAGAIDERAVHTDREGEPRLIRYDKMGNEISKVWLNEGYRKTIKETYDTGIVGYIHKEIPELGAKGNYVYAFAQGYLLSHAEPGFYCPVTLSKATAYLVDRYANAALKEKFLPHILSTGDEELYEGATLLTERQGGSDVGANEVEAVKKEDHYEISGEKYFASNAGACGVAMVLARMEGAPAGSKGLSLFLVPWEENREKGNLRIRRLKDKLGVRAVPSAEVEFEGAKGYLVGEADRGFYYMMEALNLSRVSNAVASLGIMKRAYLEARDYASTRDAFGNKLTAYPMVKETLSNMAAKQEVELQALFEVIELMDRVMGAEADASKQDEILFRLYVAIMKKETAEQAIHFSHEAIEMHGGNGYIEDFITPRLLRDAQVLTVWEGTANILGLEVLRLIGKYQVDEVFSAEMKKRLGAVSTGIWKNRVIDELEKLDEKMNMVKNLSPDMQTYYTKRMAEGMAAVFESVVALEMLESGDSRQIAVAEVFLHAVWEHDAIEETPPAIALFEEINI